MKDEAAVRHTLQRIEDRIAWLAAELKRAEGLRDALLAELLDCEGLSDRQPIGAR